MKKILFSLALLFGLAAGAQTNVTQKLASDEPAPISTKKISPVAGPNQKRITNTVSDSPAQSTEVKNTTVVKARSSTSVNLPARVSSAVPVKPVTASDAPASKSRN
jgi:hypothetical protein